MRERERDHRDRDLQRDPRAEERAREDVAAQLVGAEPVAVSRRQQAAAQIELRRVLRRKPRRKDRARHKAGQQQDAHCRQRLLLNVPPQARPLPNWWSVVHLPYNHFTKFQRRMAGIVFTMPADASEWMHGNHRSGDEPKEGTCGCLRRRRVYRRTSGQGPDRAGRGCDSRSGHQAAQRVAPGDQRGGEPCAGPAGPAELPDRGRGRDQHLSTGRRHGRHRFYREPQGPLHVERAHQHAHADGRARQGRRALLLLVFGLRLQRRQAEPPRRCPR